MGTGRRGGARLVAAAALVAFLGLAGCGRGAPGPSDRASDRGTPPAGPAAGAGPGTTGGTALSREEMVQWGQGIFRANCASCHGEAGRGGRAVALARPDLSRKYPDDGALIARIRDGDPKTGMPACASLEEDHYRALAAYIRSLADGASAR